LGPCLGLGSEFQRRIHHEIDAQHFAQVAAGQCIGRIAQGLLQVLNGGETSLEQGASAQLSAKLPYRKLLIFSWLQLYAVLKQYIWLDG